MSDAPDPPSHAESLAGTIRLLTSLLKLVRLHDGLDNVVFGEQIPPFLEHLAQVFQQERALHVEARESLVLANKRIVKGVGQGVADEYQQALGGLGLSGIWIGRALEDEELRRVLRIIQTEASQDDPAKAILEALDQYGLIAKVRVVPLGEGGGTADQQTVKVGDAEYFPLAYGRLLVLLREYARHAEDPELGRYFRQKLHRAAGEIARLVARYTRRIMALTTIRNPGDPLFSHLANVGLLSLVLGHELGLNRRQLADLSLAAFMQGVGEAFAGARAGRPRAHRILGAFAHDREISYKALCTAVVALAPEVGAEAPAAGEVHPYARMIRICAQYDGLLAGAPPDREPLRPDEAIERLFDDADQHDPTMLKAFANLIGVYPTGSVVRLSSGERAVVIYPNPGFPGRPLVAVARNADGSDGEGRLIDLAEKDVRGEYRAEIAETLDPVAEEIRASDYLLG